MGKAGTQKPDLQRDAFSTSLNLLALGPSRSVVTKQKSVDRFRELLLLKGDIQEFLALVWEIDAVLSPLPQGRIFA